MIGERFRAGPAAPLRLADGDRGGKEMQVHPGAPDAGAVVATSIGGSSPCGRAPGGLSLPDEPCGANRVGSSGRGLGSVSPGSIFGRNFAIPLGAERGESPESGWTLWGARDSQMFGGATPYGRYDGDLRSFYLGLDRRVGEDWLTGVALSRSHGETAYGFEVDELSGDGMLRTRLTTVYPYVHRRLPGGLEVWGLASLGFGEAVLERNAAATPKTGGVGLGLGTLGLRQGLKDFGALKLSLLADAGFAPLWTDGVMHGLSASVGRARLGVEGEHRLELPIGGTLSPFWQFNGRYDGGDGLSSSALELVAGTRYASERLEGQVRAHWLAVHSSSSLEEFGVSANLRIKASADGLGLTAALSPRWGAAGNGGGAQAIWREDVLRASQNGAAAWRRPEHDPWALDGRLAYGVALPHAAGVLTPFGELRLSGASAMRQRWGVRLDRGGDGGSALAMEFGVGRLERPRGGTAAAVDLTVEARF